MRNRVAVGGRLAELGELRHTPAGLPIIRFTLHHVSEQVESGVRRQVECEVPAMALTDMATRIAGLRTGQAVEVGGFLARRSRHGTQLVLHVDSLKIIE